MGKGRNRRGFALTPRGVPASKGPEPARHPCGNSGAGGDDTPSRRMPLAPDEFARLLRQHLPRMARLAVRLCGDVHAAEDLVGEAMLRATRHYRDFRGDSAFGTWLYRIVINAFRDGLRSRPDAPPPGAFADPPDPAPSPADRLGTAELAERVALLVSRLPPRQREA